MSNYQEWQINSEAASRFWSAYITVEDAVIYCWRWLRWFPLSWQYARLKKKHDAWIQEYPPITHNGFVWGEL